jgi:hypothetical protein
MQGDSCVVDITAATGILGVYYQRGYIIMGPVSNGYGVIGVFLRLNYRKRHLVNRASQLAPFTTERHTFAAGDNVFENLLAGKFGVN